VGAVVIKEIQSGSWFCDLIGIKSKWSGKGGVFAILQTYIGIKVPKLASTRYRNILIFTVFLLLGTACSFGGNWFVYRLLFNR
jgi:hypothetical protein